MIALMGITAMALLIMLRAKSVVGVINRGSNNGIRTCSCGFLYGDIVHLLRMIG